MGEVNRDVESHNLCFSDFTRLLHLLPVSNAATTPASCYPNAIIFTALARYDVTLFAFWLCLFSHHVKGQQALHINQENYVIVVR